MGRSGSASFLRAMLAAVKVNLHGLSPGTTLGDAGQRPWVPAAGPLHPMAVLLFGKRPPKPVDRRKHPRLGRALRKLSALAEQMAPFAGAAPSDVTVELCEGGNASISQQGRIFVGVDLLEQHQRDDDLLVAVIGHELGHRPWDWPQLDVTRLTRAQRNALLREEEAKADRFAGRMLAELGADPESVCRFLVEAERFEAHPPADYHPAPVRARQIREAFTRRARTKAHRPRDLR